MNVIEAVAAKHGWGDETILERPAPPPQQPTCHCPVNGSVSRLGGQDARIDLTTRTVVCATCRRVISDRCKRRQVVWLRSLLALPEEAQDFDSIPDLLLG